MFKNVGKSIKDFVSLITVINTILHAAVGLMFGALLNNPNAIIVLVVVLGIVGYLISKFWGAILYAYGELVESNQRMCEILEKWDQYKSCDG